MATKKKISELPESRDFHGLVTIGVNADNESVKVSLDFVQETVDGMNTAKENAEQAAETANEAAGTATAAAQQADSAREQIEGNESARQTSEQQRAQAEQSRSEAEGARAEAESGRTAAEETRATEFQQMKQDAETATQAANDAAERVDESITDITTEKQAAIDAAAAANQKAGEAETAAALANTAAGSAEEAAQAASGAAEAAGEAAEDAAGAAQAARDATEQFSQMVGDFATKEDIANAMMEAESILAYGIEFDTTISSPLCTRIGNLSLHRTLPVQSKMRGCLLNDAGQVTKYLNPNNWTGETRDGSQGQVMVEIPQHYRKFETDGTKCRVWISEHALPGYHLVPKAYISAYQATVQRSKNKLASVANMTADYRGGENNANFDRTSIPTLGRPANYLSRTSFRTYARNRGKAGKNGCGWNCLVYDIYKTVFWLFVIEYATRDSQANFNPSLTPEGYHQGGLGMGFTEEYILPDYYDCCSLVPCGYTDSLGNNTGVIDYTVDLTNIDDVTYEGCSEEIIDYYGGVEVLSVPRYRGIENPFGHLINWTDGINICINPNSSDGLSLVYVCSDPAKFNDSGYDGYAYVGNTIRSTGYVKTIIFGDRGEIMPATTGGSSSTNFCDYAYAPGNPGATALLHGVLFGGYSYDESYAGFAYSFAYFAPSNADSNIGSRLCFIPA